MIAPDSFDPLVLTGRPSFFGIDIANRIFHELEAKFPREYIGIDVAMGSLSSLADGLLMLYLKKYSPVDTKSSGPFVNIVSLFALVFYWLSSVATRGTQIWGAVVTGNRNGNSGSSGGLSHIMMKALTVYRNAYSAASGMHLLFAISFALASIIFVCQLSKTPTLRNPPYRAIAILAASFLVRGVFNFVVTYNYTQIHRSASLKTQLVFMAAYGLLSVVIYACIVSMAAAQRKENTPDVEVTASEWWQTAGKEGATSWQNQSSQGPTIT
jgi:hypothetical protein